LHRAGATRERESLVPGSLSRFGVRNPLPDEVVHAYVPSPLH
jgi:hypothetical protein